VPISHTPAGMKEEFFHHDEKFRKRSSEKVSRALDENE
jgi:hypothetical protein